MYDEYKNKLASFYSAHKRMPVYREMMDMFGFKSKNAVYKVVQRFIDAGFVKKDGEGKIVPTNFLNETPMLGLVTAGLPGVVDEELKDTVNIDDFLIKKKGETYMLEVDGDSMIEAHIAKGDYVIAERTEHARDGDIVIAEIDGEWTMKYLKEKNGKRWLEPANKNYKPIYPTQDLRVAAVVKGVVRKY